MATFLFHDAVFGPLHSRRLGTSLGINLLPAQGKLCNYNCIYCECGWNTPLSGGNALPAAQDIAALLEERLNALSKDNSLPDAITFSGNGEPTLHPHFPEIMNIVINLRNRLAPRAKVCVLTNATRIDIPAVADALKKADSAMLKLDAGSDAMLQLINQPPPQITIDKLMRKLQTFGGNLTVQTIFLRGTIRQTAIDNSQENEVQKWLACIQTLRPQEVMLYTIDRDTPANTLHRITPQRMREIALQVEQLGVKAAVFC